MRLGPLPESHAVGSFGASFSRTRSFFRLGSGGSAGGGQYSQTPSQQQTVSEIPPRSTPRPTR